MLVYEARFYLNPIDGEQDPEGNDIVMIGAESEEAAYLMAEEYWQRLIDAFRGFAEPGIGIRCMGEVC